MSSRARRRPLPSWAMLLALVAVLVLVDVALAHDPIARLQTGDIDGFLDDALRTEWVVAGLNGAGAAAVAVAIGRVLSRSSIPVEDQIAALDQELANCRQKATELRSRYEPARAAVDHSAALLDRADSMVTVHWAASWASDIAAAGAVALLVWEAAIAWGAVGAGAAAKGAGGLALAEEMAVAGGALAEARAAAATAQAALRAAQATERAAAVVNAQAAAQRVIAAERALSNVKDAVKIAKTGAELAQRAEQLQSGVRTTAHAVGIGAGALDTVKNADSNFWDSVKARMYWDHSTKDWQAKVDAMRKVLQEKQKFVAGLEQDLQKQEAHCEALARVAQDLRDWLAGKDAGTPGGRARERLATEVLQDWERGSRSGGTP